MPDGLEKRVTPEEFVDLIAYLVSQNSATASATIPVRTSESARLATVQGGGEGFVSPLAFRFGVNGLMMPEEVGLLSGVRAV